MALSESPPLRPPPLPAVVPPARPQEQGSCNQAGPAFRSVREGKTTVIGQKKQAAVGCGRAHKRQILGPCCQNRSTNCTESAVPNSKALFILMTQSISTPLPLGGSKVTASSRKDI